MIEIFKTTPSFDFIGRRWISYSLSLFLMLASGALLMTRGLNWGIDFTGGSLVQLTFSAPRELEELREDLAKAGYPKASPQHFTGTNTFAINLQDSADGSAKTVDDLLARLETVAGKTAFTVDKREYVGPTVGRHLYRQALGAIVFSLLGIVIYVAFRFSNPLWGLAGVLALAHDCFSAIGLASALGMEINLVFIAAVLTIAGYSINDTIVIFDRLREKMRVSRREPLAATLNGAVNDTLSRTIITSLTAIISCVTLTLFGGQVIHDFSLTMTFGLFIGVYSTVGICCPIVYDWENRRRPAQGMPDAPQPSRPGQPAEPGQPGPTARVHRGRRERRKDRGE